MATFTGPGAEELNNGDIFAIEQNPDRLFPGVRVGLNHPSGGPYPVDRFGYLGKAEPALRALDLEVTVDPTRVSRDAVDLMVFLIGADREILHLKPEVRGGESTYSQRIHINRSRRDKRWFEVSAQDCYVMLALFDKQGKVAVYAVTLMIQNNHLFLVKQQVRQAQMYRDREHSSITSPEFTGEHTNWWHLNGHAAAVYFRKEDSLPDLSEYRKEDVDQSDIGENQMLVSKFATARRQLAAGVLQDGRVARVSFRALVQDDPMRPKIIVQGMMLNVLELVRIPPGVKTAFDWEVRKATIAG